MLGPDSPWCVRVTGRTHRRHLRFLWHTRLEHCDLGGQQRACGNHARHAAIAVGQMRRDFQPSRPADPHAIHAVEQTADERRAGRSAPRSSASRRCRRVSRRRPGPTRSASAPLRPLCSHSRSRIRYRCWRRTGSPAPGMSASSVRPDRRRWRSGCPLRSSIAAMSASPAARPSRAASRTRRSACAARDRRRRRAECWIASGFRSATAMWSGV